MAIQAATRARSLVIATPPVLGLIQREGLARLIDLRNKNITGKDAELALVKAEITANKNMVPFDDKSPFVTSGIRVGTAAITTRGLKENEMEAIVALIDRVINNYQDEAVLAEVAKEVHSLMAGRDLFNY